MSEHSLNNHIVGRFISKSIESEPGDTYSYTLSDDDNAQGIFTLNREGVLMVADSNRLALEEKASYSITVKSQLKTGSLQEAGKEESFTIEVINFIDVGVNVDIRDTKGGTQRQSPLSMTDDVTITLVLIPDKSHHEAKALLGMLKILQINGDEQTREESVSLFNEKPIPLSEKHEIELWQGPINNLELWRDTRSNFTGIQFEIYPGYCLVPTTEKPESEVEPDLQACFKEEGVLFYNSEPVIIEVKF